MDCFNYLLYFSFECVLGNNKKIKVRVSFVFITSVSAQYVRFYNLRVSPKTLNHDFTWNNFLFQEIESFFEQKNVEYN